jgi:hypothetical protein
MIFVLCILIEIEIDFNRLLSMRDIAVVVEHGTPFMFSDSDDSVRKMKSFVSNGDSTVSAISTAISSIFHALLSYLQFLCENGTSCFIFLPCLDKQLVA